MSSLSPYRDLPSTMDEFAYQIFRSTAALLFLLEGMESVRALRPLPSAAEPERLYPLLAELDLALILDAPGYGTSRLLGPGAEVEQLAYRGWFERLAGLAEPEDQRTRKIWSDLHAIRSDLLDNRSVASAQGSGGCAVLTWFRTGEPIRLAMRHVLDLFNQLGLFGRRVAPEASDLAARWTLLARFERDPASVVPEIVSLRHAETPGETPDADFQPNQSRACIVFADGVFAELSPTEARGAQIDDQGDLLLADGSLLARADLYHYAVAALSEDSPPFRHREESERATRGSGMHRA